MDEDTLVKKRNKAQRDGAVQVLADVQKKLGDFYYDKKRYEDALEAYKGQLKACECLGDRLNCAIAHRMIGEVYADIENFSEALSHQNLYLEIAKELGDLIEEQRAFATLGRTHLLVADTVTEASKITKKMEALKEAKKAFSKSIRLCDKLENKIDITELMMMRARLLLNLGLVLEQHKDTEQALSLINQAAALCKKHNLHEDLHRINIALAGHYERLGNTELAFKYLDEAIKVDDIYLKVDARIAKAELLLKLGEWMEAQKLLYNIYKSKRLLEPVKQHVTKLLRIAVVLCRTEDKLLVENDPATKEKLYETMGDAAVTVRSIDKAIHFYRQMLACGEERESPQIGEALSSLAQTLRDAGKYEEAIPYARRELEEYCKDAKDTCNCASYFAMLLIDAGASHEEIRQMFDKALASARECNDIGLERSVIKDLLEYLQRMEDVDLKEIEDLNEKLESLPESVPDSESVEEDTEIGADICLDELTDLESDLSEERPKNFVNNKHVMRKPRCIVKKNEKGETLLHVACIKGNISAVEKLLEEQHPTAVRDHCGWTPLHEASNHGYVDIIRLLIRAGADVNDPGGVNCDGVTALHDAAANGHTAVVQLLLDSGANPNLLTKSGDSALDCLEQWRERVGELSPAELKEYVCVKRRLREVTTVVGKKKKKRKREEDAEDSRRRLNALVDEDGEATITIHSTEKPWAKSPEKISAGEYYKRTIASMQHPGRLLNPSTTTSTLSKINAPLIDSEEMLVDDNDWLEDDLGIFNHKRKEKTSPRLDSNGFVTAKRKTKSDGDQNHVDKSQKRPKAGERQSTPIMVEDNSCDNIGSSESTADSLVGEIWPKRKKPRQTSLLKQGFVKSIRMSRSPSPVRSEVEGIYEPPIIVRPDSSERRSWDSGGVSETLDLEIQVAGESFDLKLHFRDLRKSMNDIEDLIRHKFEAKNGCKPRMKFQTEDGVVLAPEVTLEQVVTRDRNKFRLFGEITQIDLPPIVDRYKKVCETFSIDVTDSTLKSLRICENTLTFRLSSTDNIEVEELEPLARCLHYQTTLQTLNLSSTTFYNCGDLLNFALSGLTNLYELHLQCCDIDSECLMCIEKLPPQIRVLDLSYNPLGVKSQKKLYDLLEPLAMLQTLNLRSCELDDFQFKLSSGSLVNLDLSWNPIGGDGAANFLQRQLLTLNLGNTQNLAYNRVNVIDKIFFSDSLGFTLFTLEFLDLSSCQATDLDVEKILSQTPNLIRINLSNNTNVTKTSVSAILARKPTMTRVDLSGCRLVEAPPDANLRIFTPQVCTLFVHMKHDVIDAWETLWQGSGCSKKLPHNLVVFRPT